MRETELRTFDAAGLQATGLEKREGKKRNSVTPTQTSLEHKGMEDDGRIEASYLYKIF